MSSDIEIGNLGDLEGTESDIENVKEKFGPKVAKVLGKVPFVPDAVAMYYAMLDFQTPFWVKGVIATVLLYFINPVDAVPDILQAVGYVDDATLLFMTLKLMSDYVKPEHVDRARRTLGLPESDIIEADVIGGAGTARATGAPDASADPFGEHTFRSDEDLA